MPHVDDDQPPDMGFRGARPGLSVADLSGDAAAGGWADDPRGPWAGGDSDGGDGAWADGDPPPWDGPRWAVDDGTVFTLPGGYWPRWGYRPRLHRGLGGLLRGARRVGALRSGWPVYRGRAGGRSWRVVGRPSGGRGRGGRSRELEIVSLEAEDESIGESEMFPIDASPYSSPYGAAGFSVRAPNYGRRRRQAGRRLGWRLRLPHGALHRILWRLRPDEVRRLSGAALGTDPGPALVRAVGRLARRARPRGRLSGGFTVFATPGWRLLVRPLGELQGEIVAVRPVEGEEELEVIPDKAPGFRRGLKGKQYRVRGAHATVDWAAPIPLENALKITPKPLTVYVILNGGTPTYLGETGNWRVRWEGRLRVLRELGMEKAAKEVLTVAVGTITWTGPGGIPVPSNDHLRMDVEHVLLRGYHKAGVKLGNKQSGGMILPAPAGFRVKNTGTVPPRLPKDVVDQGQDTPFELGGDPLPRG